MKLTVLVPEVSECAVTECAYNTEERCHARAITVGDGVHAACDTFSVLPTHVHDDTRSGGVGACKVTSCRHNDDLGCGAPAINVGRHQGHADCTTFERRK